MAKVLHLSRNTVAKHMRLLEEHGLIITEWTQIQMKNGIRKNGNLRYTIVPMHEVLEQCYQRQMTELERQQVQKSCRYRIQRPYVRPCEPLCGLFRSGAAFLLRREVSNHFWAASSALRRTKEEAGKNFKTGARAQVFGIQKYAPG